MQPTSQPFYARKTFRIVTALLGLALIALGIYVLLSTDASGVIPLLTGFALVVVGLNGFYAALTATRSWLSKLGPLP